MVHLTFEHFTDYLQQTLSATEMQEIDAHLAACSSCRQELLRVERFLQSIEKQTLIQPAAAITANLLDALARRQETPLDRAISQADLEYDSWTTPRTAHQRGSTQSRQLLFTADDGDIDLEIVYDAQERLYTIRGQLLLTQPDTALSPTTTLSGVIVRLTKNGAIQRRGVTDALGHFRFSAFPAGLYQLQIDWHHDRIVLDDIELTP